MKTQTIMLNLTKALFADKKLPSKELRRAAKEEVTELLHHFEVDGWDLDYNFIVKEIFRRAYGHNLEDYLIQALVKTDLSFELKTGEKGKTVISQFEAPKKKKRAIRKKK